MWIVYDKRGFVVCGYNDMAKAMKHAHDIDGSFAWLRASDGP